MTFSFGSNAGLEQHFLRNQADDLGAGDAQAAGCGGAGNFFVCHVQWRGVDVGDVHRHLGDAVFVDVPADGLAALQRAGNPDLFAVLVLEQFAGERAAFAGLAAFFAHVEGDGHRPTGGGGVEVVVHGHQEIAGADVRGAAAGHGVVVGIGAEIGPAGRIGDLLGQGLVFAGAAHREVLALGLVGRGLVAVARNAQLIIKTLRQLSSQRSALFQGDARHGDERKHVRRTRAGMSTVVVSHIDELLGLGGAAEGGFADGTGLADESDDGAVGGHAGVDVEHLDALDGGDGGYDVVNHGFIASFAVVGDAFDDLFHFDRFMRCLI